MASEASGVASEASGVASEACGVVSESKTTYRTATYLTLAIIVNTQCVILNYNVPKYPQNSPQNNENKC